MIDCDANYNRPTEKRKKKKNARPNAARRFVRERERERILPSQAPGDEIVKLEWLESSEKFKQQ